MALLQEHEYALVMQFRCDGDLREIEYQRVRPQDYEVGMVLTHHAGPRLSDLERSSLRLNFFIVLTSKMEMFPRDKLEKKLWAFKTGSLRRYTASTYILKAEVEVFMALLPVNTTSCFSFTVLIFTQHLLQTV